MSRHPTLDTPSLSSHWFVLLQNSANGNLRLTDTDSPLSPGVLHGGDQAGRVCLVTGQRKGGGFRHKGRGRVPEVQTPNIVLRFKHNYTEKG